MNCVQQAVLVKLIFFSPNLDEIKVKDDDEEEEDDEAILKILEDIVQESEASKAARKAAEIRSMLAQGEEPCRSFEGTVLDI